MDQNKIAHLGFVQAIITRMGANSFLIKGWSITLVAAIFALSAKDSDKKLVILAYFPVTMFWILDTFFLHQEKCYRKLYSNIANDVISSDRFTLDIELVRKSVSSLPECFFSKTLFPFYGFLLILIICTKFL